MKRKEEKLKDHSISALDDLIKSIKTTWDLTEEDIARRSGYNEGYISQTRSRGFVPDKFLKAVQREFKINGSVPPPTNLNGLGTPIYEAGLMIKDKEIVLREYDTEGPDFYVQIPQYRDCDYGTRAQGDRMYPEIRNGDLLICKTVDTDMVMYGDVYVLEIKGKVQTCSYVHEADNQDFYLLKARHDKFPDTVIEKSKITRIWKVRAVFKGL